MCKEMCKAYPITLDFTQDTYEYIDITNEFVLKLTTSFPGVGKIDLTGFHDVTDEGLEKVAKKCSHLHSIILDECAGITAKAIYAFLDYCPDLRELSVSKAVFLNDRICRNIAA